MARLRIDWDWKHLPSNSDEMGLIGDLSIQGTEHSLQVYYNHTQQKVVLVHGEDYGSIVVEG